MPELDPYRLPATVTPRRYDLELAPDLATATFVGSVAVDVDIHEPVQEVVLNALELDITDAGVVLPDGTRIDAEVRLDAATERAFLSLASVAPAGPAVVQARFTGILNDKLNGFYRSTFTDSSGTQQVIATTQMEATFARKAFPCWDEPAAKATFAVRLVVPEELTALSNGAEVDRESLGDGRVRVTFAETMKMSTYLVAFIVGPLELTDAIDVLGTPLRIACPKGKKHLTPYALEVADACLRWFTEYYAIPYPGGKMDLVAIPDFAFGAMENNGCVTFREVLVLVDPAAATQPELMTLTDVVNHEIAHMWFGNLVTMGWWEGIWLNEAFATFMETKASEVFRPDWNRWAEFGLSRAAAFDTDALDTTRPIEFPVVSPNEAEGMFDILTYEKGCAVLRMLEQYLGEEPMRDGIRRYLADNAYGNTVTTDLWDAIEAVSGEPVRRIMDSWIYQGGHPEIEATLADPSTLRLRQERFRLSAAIDPEGDADGAGLGERWAVPVVLRASVNGKEVEQRVLLDGLETDVPLGGDIDWVVVNAGGHGFYRVRYGETLRQALVHHGIGRLTALERFGILDDAAAGLVAGSVELPALLDIVRAYGDEPEVAVWKRLRGLFAELDAVLVDEGDRAAFQASVRAVAGPALRRIGMQPGAADDDRTRELRGVLLMVAAVYGADPEAIAEARRVREAALDDPASVDPEVAGAATIVIAETGDAADFEAGLARYRAASTPQEETRELYALARFHHPEVIERLCDLCLTEVRTQNAPYVLRGAIANRTEGERAWSFVRKNWEAINARFPSNSIVRMLEGITARPEETVAADVQAFFAEHDVPQGHKQLQQHLERQRAAVALRTRTKGSLSG